MDGLLPVKIWPLILWFCAGDLKAVRKFNLHIFSENTPAIRFLGLAKLFQVHYRLFLSVHLLSHPWVKIETTSRHWRPLGLKVFIKFIDAHDST